MTFSLNRMVATAALTIALATPFMAQAEPLTVGQFVGASNHETTGGVTVVPTADGGALVILDSDFSLDGGPDPRVGLGSDGVYVPLTDLGPLAQNTGLQIFRVPSSVDITDYDAVYIWCRDVGVPLGIADLG